MTNAEISAKNTFIRTILKKLEKTLQMKNLARKDSENIIYKCKTRDIYLIRSFLVFTSFPRIFEFFDSNILVYMHFKKDVLFQ